jgi:pyruvate dehydrogenase E2 component (dihydrolipoamide acetyltransferase)
MAGRVFELPDLGEGLEEAEIGVWLVKEGETVSLNQPLVEVETAKATVEIPSPFAGVVVRLHAAAGQVLKVGAPLVTVEVAGVPDVDAPPGPPAATPAVRRLAKDLGVDLSGLVGTGPGGRIVREDVEISARVPPLDADVEVIPVSMVRRTIAQNLVRAVREVPQVTTFRTVDCTALEDVRRALGVRPLPIVVRALAEVCAHHPMLNASYLADRGEIHVHRRVSVGIATDTDRGLLVPVVRDAGSLGITQISLEIARLADLAREGSLSPTDMAGGTITVTNTGSYGSEYGTPIINPPQGAIIALGVIESRALVVDGQVVARPACTLSLTFDHRLLDGAAAGRAFGDLVQMLESHERLEALPR